MEVTFGPSRPLKDQQHVLPLKDLLDIQAYDSTIT